jgi:hypothetical protein
LAALVELEKALESAEKRKVRFLFGRLSFFANCHSLVFSLQDVTLSLLNDLGDAAVLAADYSSAHFPASAYARDKVKEVESEMAKRGGDREKEAGGSGRVVPEGAVLTAFPMGFGGEL